jgi:hypothetical protein
MIFSLGQVPKGPLAQSAVDNYCNYSDHWPSPKGNKIFIAIYFAITAFYLVQQWPNKKKIFFLFFFDFPEKTSGFPATKSGLVPKALR